MKYIADQNGFRPENHYTRRQVLSRIGNPATRPDKLFLSPTLPKSSTVPFSTTIKSSFELTENDNLPPIDLVTKNNVDELPNSNYLSANRASNQFLTTMSPLLSDALFSTTVNLKADVPARFQISLRTSSVIENSNSSSQDSTARNNLGKMLSSNYLSTANPRNQFLTTLPLSSEVELSTTVNPNSNVFSTIKIPTKSLILTNTRFDNSPSLDSKVKNSIDSLFGAEYSISKEVNSL